MFVCGCSLLLEVGSTLLTKLNLGWQFQPWATRQAYSYEACLHKRQHQQAPLLNRDGSVRVCTPTFAERWGVFHDHILPRRDHLSDLATERGSDRNLVTVGR